MFSILTRIKRFIKRLLKVQSESRQVHRPDAASKALKIGMLIIVALLVGILYPGDDLLNPLDMPHSGEIASEDIFAKFDITVTKTREEIEKLRDEVRLTVPYVIEYDTSIVVNTIANLRAFALMIDSLQKKIDSPTPEELEPAVEKVSARFPLLSNAAIIQSLKVDDIYEVTSRFEKIFIENFYEVGLMSDESVLTDERVKYVLIRKGEKETIHNRNRLLSIAEANQLLLQALEKLHEIEPIKVEYFYLVGRMFLHPNLRFDAEEYDARLQKEFAAISNVQEVVKRNELIIRAGKKVTPRQERILDEMAEVMRSQAANQGLVISAAPAAARVLLTIGAFALLFLYLYLFRREMYNSNNRLLALLLVFVLQLIFVQMAVSLNLPNYAYPVAMVPIILTVLFDAEVGIISSFVLAMLLGVMHRFDFTLALQTVVLGTVASLISRETRKRSHFFRILLVVIIANMFYIPLVEGMKLTPDKDFTTLLGLGALAGSLSVVFSIFFIPFFESLFGITTDLTLLELSDLNHPLLKRLAFEAPGTYHHSISVGNLCEAAAKAIGANPLLARVGAYYHDIGKIEIPEYFVENQLSVKSRHELLTPTMSALILSSHVKRGRQLGEKEDIPDDVLNFIEEHHGTMVQTYFYSKAVEQGGDPKDIDKFRYPGPKPQIRETGICMLADAVEAASRTLDDPKPSRINNLIQRIINDRFQSGELDECPVTLRDLAKIKEAFTQMLIAAFHHRIEYPKKKEAAAEVS